MIQKIPFMDKVFSGEDKEYYLYVPGTTHLESDRFGNQRYVYDRYYLDENFNKYTGKYVPWLDEDSNEKWKKSTEDELINYKKILEEQKEKKVKKLA